MPDTTWLWPLVAGVSAAVAVNLVYGQLSPVVSPTVGVLAFLAVALLSVDRDTEAHGEGDDSSTEESRRDPRLAHRVRDSRGQSDPGRTAATAAGIVSTAGLAGLLEQYVLGGVIYQVGLSIIGAIDGAAMVFLAPFRAFGQGLGELVGAIVTAPISIIEMSAEYTGYSITRGDWGFFGPLTFAVGVGAVMAGLYLATKALRRLELRPWRLFRGLR